MRSDVAGSSPILQTRDLSRTFSGFTAVDRVSLSIERGSIHALIGPNGAGKTTFFNLLTKFLRPTSGTILFDGVDITHASPEQISRKGVGRSFQISATFGHLTVLDNVRVALQRKLGHTFQFWRSRRCLDRLDHRAYQLLEAVDLASFGRLPAASLSYGRRRALELATTLALDPVLMLLDEPTQGMGHEDIGTVVELIRRIGAQRTVLMVEHNLSVVETLCDRITVLQRGAILAEGSYREVSRNPLVVEAYMGSSA